MNRTLYVSVCADCKRLITDLEVDITVSAVGG